MNTESCSDVNGSQEFKCQCKEGFEGKRCEVAVCSSNYCNNNGVCSIKSDNQNDINQLQCICNYGFEGQRCEIDLCDGVTCENGFCDAGSCTCDDGYVKIESICKETCQQNPCEVFIEVIIRLKVNSVMISAVINFQKTEFQMINYVFIKSLLRILVFKLSIAQT